MPRSKPTAHAELDQLRQQAAIERMKARDLEAQLEAAEDQLEDAFLPGDHRGARERQPEGGRRRSQGEEKAIAAVKDLRHRFEGARLRVDRAQTELDTFLRERSRDLLAEREPQAPPSRPSGSAESSRRSSATPTRWTPHPSSATSARRSNAS